MIFPDYERSHTSPSSATFGNNENKAEVDRYVNPKYFELTYELNDLPANPFKQAAVEGDVVSLFLIVPASYSNRCLVSLSTGGRRRGDISLFGAI